MLCYAMLGESAPSRERGPSGALLPILWGHASPETRCLQCPSTLSGDRGDPPCASARRVFISRYQLTTPPGSRRGVDRCEVRPDPLVALVGSGHQDPENVVRADFGQFMWGLVYYYYSTTAAAATTTTTPAATATATATATANMQYYYYYYYYCCCCCCCYYYYSCCYCYYC